jgi:hypothetical protein
VRAQRGERDHRQELDCGHSPERELADRQVEAGVHHREDTSPANKQSSAVALQASEDPPRSPPDGKDERGRGDPQPRHAHRLNAREQQHSKGGAKVMEDRADDEIGVGREVRGRAPDAPRGRDRSGRAKRSRHVS